MIINRLGYDVAKLSFHGAYLGRNPSTLYPYYANKNPCA